MARLNPETEMAKIYQKQLANFNANQAPMIDELAASIDDTSITSRGKVESGRLEERSQGMAARLNTGRSSALLASQRDSQTKNITRASTLAEGSINTTAKRTERNNRVATRQQLMGIGEQLANNGTASMATAAKAKSERDARNDAAKKGFASQALSIVGTVAGGMIGGPVGAAAGGATGGMIGGAV